MGCALLSTERGLKRGRKESSAVLDVGIKGGWGGGSGYLVVEYAFEHAHKHGGCRLPHKKGKLGILERGECADQRSNWRRRKQFSRAKVEAGVSDGTQFLPCEGLQ